MTTTPKLNDLQLVLLNAAIQRDDGALLPAPDSIAGDAARVRKAIGALLKRGLVAEVEANGIASVWREEGDTRIGVVLTDDGRAMLGGGEDKATESAEPAAEPDPEPIVVADVPMAEQDEAPPVADRCNGALPATRHYGRNIVRIIELLERPEGATLSDMVAATALLPHSIRAALSGLRKASIVIAREKGDKGSVYRIVKEEG